MVADKIAPILHFSKLVDKFDIDLSVPLTRGMQCSKISCHGKLRRKIKSATIKLFSKKNESKQTKLPYTFHEVFSNLLQLRLFLG
jgi:hypothetical protein